MSQPDLDSNEPRGVLVRRQRTSIYTILLLVALLAIVASSLIMVIELYSYDFQFSPSASVEGPFQLNVARFLV